MNYEQIKNQDPEVFSLVGEEEERQASELELIPSENYTSSAVMEATGSILTNKYSEGYPKKRYYAGNRIIDKIETLAQERAKELFGVPFANVQPYSGSPANLAVYMAVCNPGDPIMGLSLTHGGHLTHGWKVSATAIYYKSYPYGVKSDGQIDIDEVWKLAKERKPRLLWAGGTAYMYKYDYSKFAEIADSVGAYFAADIAHVAGLIVGGVHPSPVPFAHIVTTTTHKTLRGPRGGMILTTAKGLEKDELLADKIDKAVFPGLQGGPHEHRVAALAVALKEASGEDFKSYSNQVVKNAKALANSLLSGGINLVGNGTENHLLLLDLTTKLGPGGGIFAQEALDLAGMSTNKNTVPGEQSSPFYPSGLRVGTPAVTTRGLKENDMVKVAGWILKVLSEVDRYRLPESSNRGEYIKQFLSDMENNHTLLEVKNEIKKFCVNFPVPGIRI